MSDAINAIREGAGRPLKMLPGEIGAAFVNGLFTASTAGWPKSDREAFHFIRSTCLCANNEANSGHHEEAARWLELSTAILQSLSAPCVPIGLGYIKFNEAYLCYARRDFPAAIKCLDEGLDAGNSTNPEGSSILLECLRKLHHRHLLARVQLAQGLVPTAVQTLIDGLQEALAVTDGSPERVELLHHACSRMAGELAIATQHTISPPDYLALTRGVENARSEGSVSEYLIFRQAYEAFHIGKNPAPMIEFIRMGRMKTVCWYVAPLVIASTMTTGERKLLAILASTWRDMPALLRSRIISLAQYRD